MTAGLIIGFGAALAAITLILIGAFCHRRVENTLTWLLIKLMPSDGEHAPGADRRRYDRLPETPVDLFGSGELTDRAGLPELPAGYEPSPPLEPKSYLYMTPEEWQRLMQAGQPTEIPETPDKPPWMITTAAMDAVPAQPVFTPKADAAEQDRAWYLKSHLADYASMPDDDIREDMRRVYAGRHAIAAVPVAEVLAAGAEPGAQMAERYWP